MIYRYIIQAVEKGRDDSVLTKLSLWFDDGQTDKILRQRFLADYFQYASSTLPCLLPVCLDLKPKSNFAKTLGSPRKRVQTVRLQGTASALPQG